MSITTTLPNPVYGVAYSQQLATSGGSGSKTFAVTSGTIPADLALSSSGLLYGTPTATTSYTFTITATDAVGSTAARSYTLAVQAPGSITAPVLARTSAPGAAPLAYTTTLNTSDTFPGDILRYQQATDSAFTAIVQDVLHPYTPSDQEAADINLTSVEGWHDPVSNVAYYIRARVQRDDGTTSAWSNTLTDTITAATTVLVSATGTRKSQYVDVSGTPILKAAGNNASVGGPVGVSGTAATSQDKSQFEARITDGSPTAFQWNMGLDNGSGGPGSNGLAMRLDNASCNVYESGAYVGSMSGSPLSGDVFGIRYAKTAGTYECYYVRGGTVTAFRTGSITIATPTFWIAPHSNSGSATIPYKVTANPGQSTQARTLNNGYAIYG